MGTPILGMCKTKTYKEIENLIATIYSNDISDFGNKSYYPQILKIVSSVNFRIFDGEKKVLAITNNNCFSFFWNFNCS